MKQSGIEWIGDIPDDWYTTRIKMVSNIIGRIGFRGYTVNDLVQKGEGAISLSPSNIDNDLVNYKKTTFLSWEKYEESPEIKIYNDDIIFVKTGSSYGKVGFVTALPEKATLNPQLVVFKNINMNNKFFYYLVSSNILKHQVETIISGSTIPTLSQTKLGDCSIVKPPYILQEKIVAYLDKSTSKVEDAIKTKQAQLKTLETLKKSIIHKAVTKGLDDSVDMKDSGIEWIGEIPEHWSIERLKDVVYINKESLSASTDENYLIKYLEISNVNSLGIISEDAIEELLFQEAPSRAKRIIKAGDTIVSSVRPNLQAIAYIDLEDDNLICSTGFYTNKVIHEAKHSKKYVYYYLLSEFARQSFISFGKGVGYPAVDDIDYRTLKIVYPLFTEQNNIVKYLDIEVEKIDSLKSNVQNQINKLKEYKKSLIYEYVTGKKQVKE